MTRYHLRLMFFVAISLTVLPPGGAVSASLNVNPPTEPVKLIFIHHSTGGNWLSDPSDSHPYGGLGRALMDNNYYASATNYGWGPEGIGDRTDIPNWPEWFTAPGSTEVMRALFNETGQNFQEYGDWPRLPDDPGGGNSIILIKSCYPNSDLFGEPYDEPATEINDQYTVANAKAVYNSILTTFAAHPDKLFIVITAPPQTLALYGDDYQTPAQRAANARALNNWLVNEWLLGYRYRNVAVFDYFNVLTGENNHHRYSNGSIEHVTIPGNDMSAYPTSEWDAHPDTTGQIKATSEFISLLNYYYNRWKGDAQSNEPLLPGADIRINGSDSNLTAAVSERLTLSVGLNAGDYTDTGSDWWIVHLPPSGAIESFNIGSNSFVSAISPVIQWGLFGFSVLPITELAIDETGNHLFCFGIDMEQNGTIDAATLCYDCISVNVTD